MIGRETALERDKVISCHVAPLTPQAIGWTSTCSPVWPSIDTIAGSLQHFCSGEHGAVLGYYPTSGEAGHLLRVALSDVESLRRLAIDGLSKLPNPEAFAASGRASRSHNPLTWG